MPKVEIRRMYIQMEYCDKQTLRSAIDEGGLHKDAQRVWRMFREILEGLVHIHTQGMIHRDLKPVNIFIDSHDHIKIGDFGLATILGGKQQQAALDNVTVAESVDESHTNTTADDGLTGQIGTALYIAPEISQSSRTSYYTQKVDMYSLGVIFFEMCYNPLQTGMERIKVLTDLRSPAVKFPADFDGALLMQQSHILRMLLDHDPTRRPNSAGLLQSDHLPPPLVEEAELREMVRHTLANDKGKAYHHLIEACLGQTMSLSQDISYDVELSRAAGPTQQRANLRRTLAGQEAVRRAAERVFRRHGALSVQMSHLLPRGKEQVYRDRDRGALVQVMTRSGGVVSLPYDLRVHFARFLARAQISNMKRYSISPVFREVKVFGVHPREQLECAFDIVTPSPGGLLPDAEVLFVADELLRELSAGEATSGGGYFIRLNHTSLLRGILLNCGIREDLHPAVHAMLRDGDRWSKAQRAAHLGDLGVPESSAAPLFNALFETPEGSAAQVRNVLRHMIRRKTAASNDIKTGLGDLETIAANAASMGLRCPVVVSPSLVYNPGHFSGMVCQVVRRKRRGLGGLEIVAAGGRYDGLVASFASKINLGTGKSGVASPQTCAVGISLSVDRLVAVAAGGVEGRFCSADVIVYSQGAVKEKSELASALWGAGVKCSVADASMTLDEAQEYAQECSAQLLVILREGESSARVRTLRAEKEQRFQERKVDRADLSGYIRDQLETSGGETGGAANTGTALATSGGVSTGGGGSLAGSGLLRSDSNKPTASQVQVNYNHSFLDKKEFNYSAKKRLESAMSAKITGSISLLAPGTLVEVLSLHLPHAVIRSVSASLDLDDETSHRKSVRALQEKHPRHRKELEGIADEIKGVKGGTGCSVFVLYSTVEHMFTVLVAA